MKLVDLQPEWVNYVEGGGLHRFSDSHSQVHYDPDDVADGYHSEAEDIAHADGIFFLCPVCFVKNGGPIGTEHVLCWFANRPHIPAAAIPGPGRWIASGTSLEDLTLSPSVNVGPEHWHGWIQNGEIR